MPYQVTFELRLSKSIHRKKQQQGQKEKEKYKKESFFQTRKRNDLLNGIENGQRRREEEEPGSHHKRAPKCILNCAQRYYISRDIIYRAVSLKREEFTL